MALIPEIPTTLNNEAKVREKNQIEGPPDGRAYGQSNLNGLLWNQFNCNTNMTI